MHATLLFGPKHLQSVALSESLPAIQCHEVSRHSVSAFADMSDDDLVDMKSPTFRIVQYKRVRYCLYGDKLGFIDLQPYVLEGRNEDDALVVWLHETFRPCIERLDEIRSLRDHSPRVGRWFPSKEKGEW